MKILFFNIITVLLCVQPIISQETMNLSIEIINIDKLEGTIRVCLIDDKKDYLSKCQNSKNIIVDNTILKTTFKNLETGTYCVTLYHDIDNNEKLNRDGLFGMPSEPYGFSNNPLTWFGPPAYKKCTFNLDSDMKIIIKL